jgi:hypothetical protein
VGLGEGKADEGWHVLVGTASSKATQRSSRQSDKTGGGAENRATRLPGESHGGGAGSGCELTC